MHAERKSQSAFSIFICTVYPPLKCQINKETLPRLGLARDGHLKIYSPSVLLTVCDSQSIPYLYRIGD